MKTFLLLFSGCLVAFLESTVTLSASDPVVIHEWGTFTCLQDEQGRAIGGVNVDDEPVPGFVCFPGGIQVAAQYSHEVGNFGLPPYSNGKGWVPGDSSVTMRLETPVVYIYPPKGQKPQSVPPLDVHVDFHGGLLSQYYPFAHNESSLSSNEALTDQTTSGLTWKGVRIGSPGKPVETRDKVWTTPREVGAPLLEVPVHLQGADGVIHDDIQVEHFLFYRGIGHFESPLIVAPNGADKKGKMEIGAPPIRNSFSKFDWAWMVEIRPDGSCAFHTLHNPESGMVTGMVAWFPSISASFTDHDFSASNLTRLKISMQEALVKEGLYPDEASAMLRTWELSYFKSPGLRFFYTVPRAWVDRVLPLQVTGAPTEITRVMVGRIELIADKQRAALTRLATGPCPNLDAVKKAAEEVLQNSKLPKGEIEAFYRGEKPLNELGIAIPPLVQDYLNLGRFRDALVLHEQREHPSQALAQLIKDNQIGPQGN